MVKHLTRQYESFHKALLAHFETQMVPYTQNEKHLDSKNIESIESIERKKLEILQRIRLIESSLEGVEKKTEALRESKAQYEHLKANYPNQVAELNRQNQLLAHSIESVMFEFLAKVEESQNLGLKHNAFLNEIQSGNNPEIQAIERILNEFEAYAHQKIQEIRNEISVFNEEARQFNQISISNSNELDTLFESAQR